MGVPLKLLRRLYRLLAARPVDSIEYWNDRARQHGARAALNLGHSEEEVDAVTQMQCDEIFPYFQRELSGGERVVLDFGCGPGRFSGDLARLINGSCIAVDPVQSFLDLAPKHPSVSYQLLPKDCHIPMQDDSADVVWVCLVLGGVGPGLLSTVCSELLRVLKLGGLLFLVESTSQIPDSPTWSYRSIAEYHRLFPEVNLKHLHDYFDLGQRISIMSGRMPS